MTERRAKIIVTRKLPDAVEARMAELFEAEFNATDNALTREELEAAVQSAEILVPTLGDHIDAELLAKGAGTLKMVANFGAGVDHIDLAAAKDLGLIVTNTPGVLTEDTADLAMALTIAVPRRMREGMAALRKGEFSGWTPTWMMGKRLSGKKLGIIGMGRVGQALARRAKAFGLEIHYHNRNQVNPYIEEELEATYWDSLDRMLPGMDIVSVNCPHTPATYHLLSKRRLELLPKHAIIINTARGEVIDQLAMTDMLEEGRLAGAGLDVFEKDMEGGDRLLKMQNVLVTPHLGSATEESRIEMGERVIINIKTFIDGHRPPDRVYPRMF